MHKMCAPSFIYLKRVEIKHIPKLNELPTILSVVAEVFKLTIYQLKSKNRARPFPDARKAFYYLASAYSDAPKSAAAKFLGQKHCAGLYSIQQCQNLMDIDAWYKERVQKCAKQLQKIEIIYL